MRPFSEYDLVIFDCDGVILDSNALKVNAMKLALRELGVDSNNVEECGRFFANNFGKSRYYHVDYFVENILHVEPAKVDAFKADVLHSFSDQCKALYSHAKMTPFVEDVLSKSKAVKYVASGSDQAELRGVLKLRELDRYFDEVFGSPEKKTNHVATILTRHPTLNAVMIGDAASDMDAAEDNGIDFIFYSPYSNVEEKMRSMCLEHKHRVVDTFQEILKEL